MLKSAIQHIIHDSNFHLNVEPAATALQKARCVWEWSGKDENKPGPIFEELKKTLEELKTCVSPNATSSSARSFGYFFNYTCAETTTV